RGRMFHVKHSPSLAYCLATPVRRSSSAWGEFSRGWAGSRSLSVSAFRASAAGSLPLARDGSATRFAAGPAANRVADPSLAKGNEPAADARKADTDKDLEPAQPRENSPQAEDERRTGVAKQ